MHQKSQKDWCFRKLVNLILENLSAGNPGSQLQSLLQQQAGHLLEADPSRSNAKWYGENRWVYLKDGFQGGSIYSFA